MILSQSLVNQSDSLRPCEREFPVGVGIHRQLCDLLRVEYSNVVLAGAQKIITNKLQCAMNAAACVLTGTRKFNHGLTQIDA